MFKKIFTFGLCIPLIIPSITIKADRSYIDTSKYVNNEILVSGPDVLPSTNIYSVNKISDGIYLCKVKSDIRKAIDLLSKNKQIKQMQPNYIYTTDDFEKELDLYEVKRENSNENVKLSNETNDEKIRKTGKERSEKRSQKTEEISKADTEGDGKSNSGCGGIYGGIDTYTDLVYSWFLKNTGELNSSYDDVLKGITPVDFIEGVDINADDISINNSAPINIGIIDTGINGEHPYLKDCLWTNEKEIPDNGVDDDNNGYIDDVHGWNFCDNNNQVWEQGGSRDDNHGTHSAGIIKRIAEKVNANVKIVPIRIMSKGKGTTAKMVEALKYAKDNNIKVCNFSLGTNNDDLILKVALNNVSEDVLLVAASGNGDSDYIGYDIDKSPVYPASSNAENVLSVANIKMDGTLHYTSNYGATAVDIAAPGTNIFSCSGDGESYHFATGTSSSAPVVSAIVGIGWGVYPNLPLSTVKKTVIDTASKENVLKGKCVSEGIVNFKQFIDQLSVEEELRKKEMIANENFDINLSSDTVNVNESVNITLNSNYIIDNATVFVVLDDKCIADNVFTNIYPNDASAFTFKPTIPGKYFINAKAARTDGTLIEKTTTVVVKGYTISLKTNVKKNKKNKVTITPVNLSSKQTYKIVMKDSKSRVCYSYKQYTKNTWSYVIKKKGIYTLWIYNYNKTTKKYEKIKKIKITCS